MTALAQQETLQDKAQLGGKLCAGTLLLVLAAACGGSGAGLQPSPGGQAAVTGLAAARMSAGRAAQVAKRAELERDAAIPGPATDAGGPQEEDASAPTGVMGSSSAGAGGQTAGAGGYTAGAGGSSGSDAGAAPPLDRGPYFTSGRWHGYFWTAQHAAGTTLTSSNFSRAEFEPPICIQGSVAPTADNTGNAMLGVNLNQGSTGELMVQTITPSLDGVVVQVKNNGASPLRLQIQALDGDTNDQARWCVVLSGSGGFIPWSQFNTACWDGSGTAYQRQPISGAMLLVPGAVSAAVRYDVCLEKLAEATSPTLP